MKVRVLLTAVLSAGLMVASSAFAKTGVVSGCTVVVDPRGDEQPGPLVAVGYDPRDLDLLGFELRGDGKHLVVRTRSAHLTSPLVPTGYRLSYKTYWGTHSAEGGNRSFELTADFDGSSALYTLGVTAAGDPAAPDGSGKTYTQVGGPLHGTIDYSAAEVTVDIPYALITQYASGKDGMTLLDPAVGSYWGFGNPSVRSGATELVGSSGYNKLADGATADYPFRLGRRGRCTS